jgi:hypothetical protein
MCFVSSLGRHVRGRRGSIVERPRANRDKAWQYEAVFSMVLKRSPRLLVHRSGGFRSLDTILGSEEGQTPYALADSARRFISGQNPLAGSRYFFGGFNKLVIVLADEGIPVQSWRHSHYPSLFVNNNSKI